MKLNKRHIAASAVSSTLQVLISAILYFSLYRMLLAQLGPKLVGVWSLVLASTMAARLTDLGLTTSVVKFVAQYQSRTETLKVASVVNTAVITIAVIFAVLSVAAYPLIRIGLDWALPADSVPLALRLLPIALLALWMNAVAGVYQAALDGLQLIARKNVLLIASNAIFFFLAVGEAPGSGLIALAWAQVFQAAFLLIVGYALTTRGAANTSIWCMRWSSTTFREMLGYSFKYQISAIAVMLCDPLTKLLMSKYGGLELTAYYDMANQLINKVKALLISGHGVLVPVIAAASEGPREHLARAYSVSYTLMLVTALPTFAVCALLLPCMSTLWVGEFSPEFVHMGLILVVAYLINAIEVPAHYNNMGTGRLNVNVIGQVAMGVGNAALGSLLGRAYGAYGVAIGFAIALVGASLWIMLYVHFRDYCLKASDLVPTNARRVLWWTSLSSIILLCGLFGTPIGSTWQASAILASAEAFLALTLFLFNFRKLVTVLPRQTVIAGA